METTATQLNELVELLQTEVQDAKVLKAGVPYRQCEHLTGYIGGLERAIKIIKKGEVKEQ